MRRRGQVCGRYTDNVPYFYIGFKSTLIHIVSPANLIGVLRRRRHRAAIIASFMIRVIK